MYKNANQTAPAALNQVDCKCPSNFVAYLDADDDTCKCKCPPRPNDKPFDKTVCESYAEGEGFTLQDRRYKFFNFYLFHCTNKIIFKFLVLKKIDLVVYFVFDKS